ncbi:hypothetical protein D3C80_2001850 [compost metagenome]
MTPRDESSQEHHRLLGPPDLSQDGGQPQTHAHIAGTSLQISFIMDNRFVQPIETSRLIARDRPKTLSLRFPPPFQPSGPLSKKTFHCICGLTGVQSWWREA